MNSDNLEAQKSRSDFKEINYATGRRKKSIARVWVKKGSGKILVNGKEMYKYFKRPVHQISVVRPLQEINSEKEFDVKLKYRNDAYGHIMHYRNKCDGLHWHNEPGMAYVSASVNVTPDHMYEGAEFEIKDWDGRTPYKSLILYHSIMTHRVTELVHGEKMSFVMWLPKHDQKINHEPWKME